VVRKSRIQVGTWKDGDTMMRKWEFIKYYLSEIIKKKKGKKEVRLLLDAIYLADWIDEVLEILYEDEHTKSWEDDYERWKNKMDELLDLGYYYKMISDLINIAGKTSYCIACRDSSSCNVCKFGYVVGRCNVILEWSPVKTFFKRLRKCQKL